MRYIVILVLLLGSCTNEIKETAPAIETPVVYPPYKPGSSLIEMSMQQHGALALDQLMEYASQHGTIPAGEDAYTFNERTGDVTFRRVLPAGTLGSPETINPVKDPEHYKRVMEELTGKAPR